MMFSFSSLRNILSNSKGMSVIEVVVVLVILTVGIVGAYQIVNSGARLTNTTESRIKAISYAREGLEWIENIRDTNWLKFSSDYRGCFDTLGYNVSCVGSNPGGVGDSVPRIGTGSYSLSQWASGLWELSLKTPSSGTSFTDDNISGVSRTDYLANFAVYLDGNGLTTQSGGTLPNVLCTNSVFSNCKTGYAREIRVTRPDSSTITAEAIVSWVDPSRVDPFIVRVPYTIKNWKVAYLSATPMPTPLPSDGVCGTFKNICMMGGVPQNMRSLWTCADDTWDCAGQNGGLTVSCSTAKNPLPAVCTSACFIDGTKDIDTCIIQ